MSVLDPGGLFGTFQRVQEEEIDAPTSTKSQVLQMRTVLFGVNEVESSTEASTSERSFSPSTSPSRATHTQQVAHIEHLNESLDSASHDQYEVSILGIPESGVRSRTETQVKIILHVVPKGTAPLIRYLHLPRHQLSGRKLASVEEDIPQEDATETLHVRARVVRSDSDERIYACYSCILRERKRDARKRARIENYLDECEVAEKEAEQDRERILIFASTSNRVQLLRGDVMLPVRLTCYCRHLDERVGFRVMLELLNDQHKLVGFAYSPPIMITDDHKRVARQLSRSEPTSIIPSSLSPPQEYFGEPRICKVVPAEGPMYGGIEVTVLGENFTEDTVLMFGQYPSSIVTFVSSSTIVIRLPPSHAAGIVPVQICGQPTTISASHSNDDYILFNYKNDLDSAMMELALQLIGMKMTGRVDDARDVAMRIINEFTPSDGAVATVSSNERSRDKSLERVLITCLAAATSTGGVVFTSAELQSVRTAGGQTLLHLAALAQYDHLFEYLSGIEGGSLLNILDHNRFSPVDLYLFIGRREFLETLGLDDSEDEDTFEGSLDVISRYQAIQARAKDRSPGHRYAANVWDIFGDAITRLRRRPARMRNHMNRLKNVIWRKLSSEESIKEYYLKSFGTTTIAQKAGSKLYQSFIDLEPVRQKSRNFLLLYYWIPILIAMILVWYFDLGSSVAHTVATWTDPVDILVQ